MDSSVWYYVINGAQVGPVGLAELKAAVAAGKVGPADLVWQEGTPEWVAARTVPALFATTAPPTPAADGAYPLADPGPPARRPGIPAPVAEPLSLDDEGGRAKAEGPSVPPLVAELFALAQRLVRRAFAPDPTASALTPEEGARLTAAGVMDATARKLAVWRRSVLFVAAVPCAFAALLGLIDVLSMGKEDRKFFSAFGIFLQFGQALALFALPVAAVFGALAYDRLSASMKWVTAGGLVSFLVPMAVAFVPTAWQLDLKIEGHEKATDAMTKFAGVLMGVKFYFALLPAILTLLPAVARACVRMKMFLPESLVPGWGLVTSVPLCVLLTLATFVVLYHAANNLLLILGLLLWIGAPLAYFTKFRLFTKPLTQPAERAAVARASLVVLGLIAAGFVLLIAYMFTAKFADQSLLGFDKDALLRPWTLELHQAWIDYVGRSLFLTVLFADVLLWVALSVWREQQAFAASPEAPGFDRTMTGLGAAVLPRGSSH
jgi:hypothetical protein